MKIVVLIIAGLFTITSSLDADVLAKYGFDNSFRISSDLDLPSIASTFSDGAGVTATFDTGRGSPAPSLSIAAASTDNDKASAISGNDYVTFTITPAAGFKLNLSSFTFDYAIFGTGSFSGTFVVRSSMDNFVADLGIATSSSTTFATKNISLAGTSFQDVTSAISFRIFVYDGNNGSGKGDLLDNVTLNGVVSPASIVPEPATWAMLIAGAGLLVSAQRFRRSKS